MQRWWRLAIATWSANPGRTMAVVVSVTLGVSLVVIVSNFFETARKAITEDVVKPLMGSAHVTVHPIGAHWGSIDVSLAADIARVENVQHVSARLRRRARLVDVNQADKLLENYWLHVDAIGINPVTEEPFLTLPALDGRMMTDGERGVAVIERPRGEFRRLTLGDDILLTPFYGGPKKSFTIIGFFDSVRVAEFQHTNVYVPLADVWELEETPGVVSAIDVMLFDASPEALRTAASAVERLISERKIEHPTRVETAAARQLVLSEAERITRMLLLLTAFISMMTSFFIILTTQSVGMSLRRPQLGVMRCVGLTRGQLSVMLVMEMVPLGVVGTILGIFGGVTAGSLIARSAAALAIAVELSPWSLYLAVTSGIATTAISTVMVIVQVGRVTPLEAVHVDARPARLRYIWIASAFGVLFLGLHQLMAISGDRTQWLSTGYALLGTGLLYLGYVLLAPAVVFLLGRPIARLVGRLMGVGARLTEDPFIRAPWRTTGACWVLMVGLSLIVYVAVRAQSILEIWDYPAQLPSAFVWSQDYVPGEVIDRVSRLPGVGTTTVTTDVPCVISKPGVKAESRRMSIVESFLKKLTKPVFVAGDPDSLLGMIKVAFTEGNREDALPKLRRGGYVLLPPETARNHQLRVGDKVAVSVRGRSAEFEVAGIVESPALDLAVTAFQAQSYMQIAAASAILGTRADLKEKFGLDVVSMFMCDIELAPTPVPSDFDTGALPDTSDDAAVAAALLRWESFLPEESETLDALLSKFAAWQEARSDQADAQTEPVGIPPPEIRAGLQRYAKAIQRLRFHPWTRKRTSEQNWTAFRERLILLKIAQEMDRPDAVMGSLRQLKQQVDKLLTRALTVMTWLPSVLLLVAAIGIANLMMISVHQRTRQIAVLRAVGAQKSQILRLVLAEAIAIGLLGSVMGIALGLHEADSANRVILEITDVTLAFVVPVGTIALGALLTVGICLLAAVAPARYAARNNIIEAMQTT